jgi:hypothetical protein
MRSLRVLFHEETALLAVRKIPFPELTRYHNNVVLMVTDLVMYGSHDERKRLANAHVELSSQSR